MGIRNKIGGSGESGLSKEGMEKLKNLIEEAVNRSNKERDTAIVNLRIEVYELRNRIEELTEKVNILQPISKEKLIEEIDSLNIRIKDINKEAFYKKFFSGDNGFLSQLPDILSGIKGLENGEVDINEINKFYAKNFYPVSNNVIILNSSLDKLESTLDLSQLSIEELIKMRGDLSKLISEADELSFPQFYSELWKAVEDDLKRLCDPDYEDKFKQEDSLNIQKELMDAIGNIESALVSNGIEIVYTPSAGSEEGFMPAADPTLPAKPLIRRDKDKYIYAYGLYSK